MVSGRALCLGRALWMRRPCFGMVDIGHDSIVKFVGQVSR